jgi:hypothetical protein
MQISKVEIHQTILYLLSDSILQAKRDYELAKDSRDSDTKSSAGDKFETGREMMQREMDKISASIDQYKNQISLISKINLTRSYPIIDLGSLINTNLGHYFISIGLGKVEISGESLMVISLDSPIGQLLKGKRAGDTVSFRENNITIHQIS